MGLCIKTGKQRIEKMRSPPNCPVVRGNGSFDRNCSRDVQPYDVRRWHARELAAGGTEYDVAHDADGGDVVDRHTGGFEVIQGDVRFVRGHRLWRIATILPSSAGGDSGRFFG
jgi:hypothetical protein